VKEFTAETIDFITYAFRAGDYDRAKRRSLIDGAANGQPPFTEQEVEENNIPVNVSTLALVRAAHDARAQYSSASTKPGVFFQCRTDAGAKHKRMGYGITVTNLIGKCMKRSLAYYETKRSKIAQNVLHGICPSVFEDSDCWGTRPIGIEDAYVPSNTQLYDIATGRLPMFAIYRTFNGTQLKKLAKAPISDPGWNQPLVDACLKWIYENTLSMAGDQWTDYLSPEKWEERVKGDGTFFTGDRVPTVNAWDFYYWDDDKDTEGWYRKMILDTWTMPSAAGARTRRQGKPFERNDQFLYNPKGRKYASKLNEIINWQFADLSAVAPFNYHTVRSLGWLLYSTSHLNNRLFCKVMAATFEQLMIYMRVKSEDDMQRALSVNLVDRGFIDGSISFIPPSERYQINAQLAQMALTETSNLINRGSSSFTAKVPSSAGSMGDMKVPTATQWLGEEAKVTQLVSAGLAQAYEYERPEFYEIFRRFTKKGSKDPEVNQVQAKILKAGVPSSVLYNLASWDIEPERVIGGGNKTMETAIAQQLLAVRHLHDPQAQRKILQIADLAFTDDAALTAELVPDEPKVSSSTHDAQLAVGTLLMGQPMELRQNVSHVEYAQSLVNALGVEVEKVNATGGVTDQTHIVGMQNLAGQTIEGQPVPGNGAANHVALIAEDPMQVDVAKTLGDQLSKLLNEVRAFAQRLEEQQQQQAAQGPQMDAETQAKIISMQATTEAKNENTRNAHAQRTAQRQVAFEMQQQQKAADAELALKTKLAETQIDLSSQSAQALIELEKQKNAATSKPANS